MSHDESHNPPDRELANSSEMVGASPESVESSPDASPIIQAELGESPVVAPPITDSRVSTSSRNWVAEVSEDWAKLVAKRPRIWTALAVAILALPLGWIVSLIVTWLVLVATVGPAAIRTPAMFSTEMKALSTTPLGLVVMALPGQLTFLACALGAAALSPVPWRERLGLGRGTFPIWSWPVLAFATPVVAFITSLTLGMFMKEPSDHMLWMEKLFREQPLSLLPLLLLLIGVLPGLGEELLYRGYVQGRLAKVWPASLSILLTSVIFGLAHVDPTHALHVIPLGIWLGILAWRTESLWPTILGHAANNSLALIMMRMIDRSTTPPTVNHNVGILVLGALGSFVIALVLLVISGRPLTWRDIFCAPHRP